MLNIIKKLPQFASPFLIILAIFFFALGLAYIIRGDIYFFTDIARDFLILDEISTKHIVLIGPRASGIAGAFHGVAWAYLNWPVYFLSGGNPTATGFFWAFLTAIFLITTWWLITKIATKNTASLTTLLLAMLVSPAIYTLYNPYAALFIMPVFLFTVYQYLQTKAPVYLLSHLLILGLLLQFSLSTLPLVLLSFALLIYQIITNRRWHHLAFFLIILIPLSTFILFELKHGFPQTLAYLHDPRLAEPFFPRLTDRLLLTLKDGWQLFNHTPLSNLNFLFSALVAYYLFITRKNPPATNRLLHLSLYYYCGFFAVSILDKGYLMGHHYLPTATIACFIIAFIIINLKAIWPKLLVALAIGFGLVSLWDFATTAPSKIGQIEDDWLFQKQLAATVFNDGEPDFGYFIYTPDVIAYESKAAMNYLKKLHPDQRALTYHKQPVTYLIIAPYLADPNTLLIADWKTQEVGLVPNASPAATFTLPAGYTIEKYFLDDAALAIPHNSALDGGMLYR